MSVRDDFPFLCHLFRFEARAILLSISIRKGRMQSGQAMALLPGQSRPRRLASPGHDENDPWTQRFVSRTDDGRLVVDVQVM